RRALLLARLLRRAWCRLLRASAARLHIVVPRVLAHGRIRRAFDRGNLGQVAVLAPAAEDPAHQPGTDRTISRAEAVGPGDAHAGAREQQREREGAGESLETLHLHQSLPR